MTDKRNKKPTYQPADKENWQGRAKSDSKKESEYWFEEIQLIGIDKLSEIKSSEKCKFSLIGYLCDEGVRRNQGRIGAKSGPDAIRERLAKIAIHFSDKEIFDLGNVICPDQDMEACQKALAVTVKKILQNNTIPIVAGGGHDVAYGHFKGIEQAVEKDKRIGIINFDAHFDLRPIDKLPNSGTPFNQIFSEFGKHRVDYLVVGIQQQGNTKELFEIAKKYNVKFIPYNKCTTLETDFNDLKKQLDKFISTCDVLYISIDMDGFSSAYAPGVSAPSPLGFTPDFFFKTMLHILASQKVISFDIAELNPKFDIDNHTASLAARIVDFIVTNW